MTEQEEYFDDSFEDSFDDDSDSGDFAEYDDGSADLRSHSDTAIAIPTTTFSLPALRREIQLPPGFAGGSPNYGHSPSHSTEQDDQSAFSRYSSTLSLSLCLSLSLSLSLSSPFLTVFACHSLLLDVLLITQIISLCPSNYSTAQ